MKPKNLLATLVLLLAVIYDSAEGQIPRTLSYQGVLTDSLGNAKRDGEYEFTFRLYSSPTEGPALWTESKSIRTKRGLFYTILGQQTAFPPSLLFDKPYWLSIQVGNEPELSPRIALTSVGYSFNTLRADVADTARRAPPALITDGSITNLKLAPNAITTDKILDGTIQRSDVASNFKAPDADIADTVRKAPTAVIPDGSITSQKLGDGQVKTIDIEDGGVTQGKLAVNSVSNAKIASGAVTTEKLADATITTGKIADNAVTNVKLAEASVTTGKILDGAITNSKLGSQSITGDKIQNYTIKTENVSPDFRPPRSANADSVNGIPAFFNPRPHSLYPLDNEGNLRFQTGSLSSLTDYVHYETNSERRESSALAALGAFLVSPAGALTLTGVGVALPYAIQAINTTLTGVAVHADGWKYGVEAKSDDGSAIYARSTSGTGIWATSTAGLAGKFDGNVSISGNLSVTGSISGSISGTAGGDLSGSYPNPAVSRIQGRSVSSNSPSTNQVLKWTGSQWAPGTDETGSGGGGTVTSITAGSGLAATPSNPITTSGTISIPSNAVTSSMILDGTIVGSDISTSTTISTRNVYGNGSSSSYGIEGYSSDGVRAGVVGSNSHSAGTGVFGTGNALGIAGGLRLIAGSGGSFTGTQYGVAGFSKNTSGLRAGGYFENNSAQSYAYVAAVTPSGTIRKIEGNGTVNTVMQTRSGVKSLFAPESPEAWIEDISRGQLLNGHSRIDLDPLFLDCVAINETMPLNVFITLNDDCNGVYVKTDTAGFDVYELKSGTSSAKFTYKIVAKWKGYEMERFPDAIPRLNTIQSAPTSLEK